MKTRFHRREVLRAGLSAACALPGCQRQESSRFGRFRPREQPVLHFNIFAEPETIDPALLSGHPDAFVAHQLFEGLVELDGKTLAPLPALAKRWSLSNDQLSLVFELREDALWSDGVRVDASDLVFSWERALRPSTASRNAYQLYPLRNARLYNQGRIKRIREDSVRPRRPPFVEFGSGSTGLAPTLNAFPPGAVVRLLGSNLRQKKLRTGALVLRTEPRDTAPALGELVGPEVGVVLARQLPPGKEERPGRPHPESWVQLRPPSGGRAGWARESEVTPAFPSTDLRRLEGERKLGYRKPLLVEPEASSPPSVVGQDEDPVEIQELRPPWARLLHLPSRRVGWALEGDLDDAAGNRNWFYVEVMQRRPGLDAFASEGWVAGRDLTADASILGVKALGPHRLEVRLEQPTPYFVSLLAHAVARPVPRHVVERWGRGWTRPSTIVSNGAFRLDAVYPRDRLELTRAPTYHGVKAVGLERVVVYSVEDEHTSVNMYRAGYLDAMLSAKLPVELVPWLRNRRDYVAEPYWATYFAKLNTTAPPLDDVRVRRALNQAIDKQLLCGRLLAGGQQPATHLVPPGLSEYPVVPGDAFDPRAAKRWLAEAGYPEGRGFPKLEYLYNTSEQHRIVAEYLQRQWQDVLGIDVALVNQEWKTYLKRLHAMDYQITRSGWIGDYLDPLTFLELFQSGSGNNETGFASAPYDESLRVAIETAAPKERFRALARAESMLNEAVPVVPLFYYVNNLLVAPEVEGFFANLLDVHPLRQVSVRLSEAS